MATGPWFTAGIASAQPAGHLNLVSKHLKFSCFPISSNSFLSSTQMHVYEVTQAVYGVTEQTIEKFGMGWCS